MATALCAVSHINVHAQRRGETITERDKQNIIASATLTLFNFMKDLDVISDENYPVSTKSGTIDMMFNSQDYVCKKNATIEDDLDPTVHSSGKQAIQIADYLNNLMTSFKRLDTTSFKAFDILCVKKGRDKSMYIQVPFTQTLNGTDQNGVKFTKNNRVASMTIIRMENGEWKAVITDISFYDPSKYKNEDCIDIGEAGAEVTEVASDKPESYYTYLLQRGSRLLGENKFDEAYFCYREVKQSPEFTTQAKQKIETLYDKMRRSGTQGVNDDLCRMLTYKGRDLEAMHRYPEAYRYYSYAQELNPTSADLRSRKSAIADKASLQRQLEKNYDKQLYEQGVTDYTNAIKNDPENSAFYLGRAKCYGMLINKDAAAKNDFNAAIRYDPSNKEVYYWKGKFFEQKNTINAYDSAYASFVFYISRSDDKVAPELASAAAEATFCKGMSLYMQGNFQEAIDSFGAAIKQNEQYKEAWCYQGWCYSKINDVAKANDCFKKALKIDDKYPDAHFRYGQTLLHMGGKKNSDEGIIEMGKGISLLPNLKNDTWYSWNSEMGDMLVQKGKYEEAIAYYDKCVDDDFPEYTLKRGECYLKMGNKDKARADFHRYEDQCKKKNIPQAMRFRKDMEDLNKEK